MSAFAPVARVLVLVALCCSAAYADMSPNQTGQPAIVLAAMSVPDGVLVPVPAVAAISIPEPTVPTRATGDDDLLMPKEPFVAKASGALPADMSEKWRELQSRIDADEASIAACRIDEKTCSSAAHRFLSLVDIGLRHTGRARLGMINRAVNLGVRPVSDLEQYGYPDFWASPLQTLASAAGDCEDYAIVKYVLLRDMGFDASDLRFVIVRDNARQTEHAVVAVREAQEWLILDNRTMAILASEDVRQYQPLFSLDQRNARAFASAASESVTDR